MASFLARFQAALFMLGTFYFRVIVMMTKSQKIKRITLFDSGAVSRLDHIIAKKIIGISTIFAAAPMTINELINSIQGNKNIRNYGFKLLLDWEEIIRYEILKLNKQRIVTDLSNFPLKNGKYQRIPQPNLTEIQNHFKDKEELWQKIPEIEQTKIAMGSIDSSEDEHWKDFQNGNFDGPPNDFTLFLQNEIIKFGPKIIKDSCPSFRGLIRVLALLSLIKKIKGQTEKSSISIVGVGILKTNNNLLPDFQIIASCPYVNQFVSLDESQTNFAMVVFPGSVSNIKYIPQSSL